MTPNSPPANELDSESFLPAKHTDERLHQTSFRLLAGEDLHGLLSTYDGKSSASQLYQYRRTSIDEGAYFFSAVKELYRHGSADRYN